MTPTPKKYLQSKSTHERRNKLRDIIKSSIRISDQRLNMLLDKMAPLIIHPGAKASIDGNAFNKEISRFLNLFIKKKPHLTLDIEKKHTLFDERPDWILKNAKTSQTIIGFNQLDLWSGGHQYNRASKYVLDETLHRRMSNKNIKIVCIVKRKPKGVIRANTKLHRIFSTGHSKSRLFYKESLREFLQKNMKS
jgi:hypothetical protein